jgi:hypothetical protein
MAVNSKYVDIFAPKEPDPLPSVYSWDLSNDYIVGTGTTPPALLSTANSNTFIFSTEKHPNFLTIDMNGEKPVITLTQPVEDAAKDFWEVVKALTGAFTWG